MAGQLDSENEFIRSIAIHDAVEAGTAFYVWVRPDILAVDFDGANAPYEEQRLYCDLRMAGHLPVLLASGQPGRRHLFCLIPDPTAPARDLIGPGRTPGDNRRSIRPPLAPHRYHGDGVKPQLLLPRDPDDALRRLTRPGHPRAILERSRQAILAGVRTDDRSDDIIRGVLPLARAGWTAEEVRVLLRTPGSTIHEAFADRASDRGDLQTETWFDTYIWPKVTSLTDGSWIPEHPERAKGLMAWALSAQWQGRAHGSDKRVYLALCGKYQHCGRNPFRASHRELAEAAGLQPSTVRAALSRLQRDELVRWVAPHELDPRHAGDQNATSVWELLDPPGGASNLRLGAGGEEAIKEVHHDAWRNGSGLSSNALDLWLRIRNEPGLTVEQLTERVTPQRRTVHKHLAELLQLGLVVQEGTDLYPGDATPDDVVPGLRSQGTGERQRQLHDRERRGFAEAVGREPGTPRSRSRARNNPSTGTPPRG